LPDFPSDLSSSQQHEPLFSDFSSIRASSFCQSRWKKLGLFEWFFASPGFCCVEAVIFISKFSLHGKSRQVINPRSGREHLPEEFLDGEGAFDKLNL
jgi:hypothetical protein